MTSTTAPQPLDAGPRPDPRQELGDRLFADMLATAETFTVFLGVHLGLYEALREHGPLTASELAARAGIDERYAREWLEQQAVTALVAASAEDDPDRRRYRLGAVAAEVLTDPDSPYYAAGVPLVAAACARALPLLGDAYRQGRGVPYADYGWEVRDGIAAFNRPAFLHELGAVWLPSIDEVHERLSTKPGARVLDLGCGSGTSSLAIARAYTGVHVLGIDLDQASIVAAREAARAAGLGDRVTFRLGDAADDVTGGGFDLVTVFEALHDMGDPVGALRTARRLLADGGSVLVADERVADRFTAPGDELERLNYAFSVLHCLPATRAEDPVEANGTVLRAGTLRRWATDAGFRRIDELGIDFPFWRFYRLAG